MSETRTHSPSSVQACQNCKQNFIIEDDDFAFYKKIDVPPPTWCPECRMIRRFLWRNERTLYKRECSLCKKGIIALYSSDAQFPVYCHDCWYSDKWDPLEFGLEYNSAKPFFEQLHGLMQKVPRLGIWVTQSKNSDYTNQSYNNKNVYLSFALRDSEDSSYITRAVEVKYCFDDTYTHHSEFLYQCINTDKSYQSRFLEESEGIVGSMFLSNCRNSQECIGGVNLRAASHVFFGEQISKEEYSRRVSDIDFGSRMTQEKLSADFDKLKEKAIYRFAKFTNCINSTGDHLHNARNCHAVFDGFELENARYSSWVFTSKEISDCYGMGGSEFVYEGIGVEEVNNLKFCNVTDSSNHVEYTDLCQGSSNLFGCVALRQKQYCILNKQYSKEEYQSLREKIVDAMRSNPYEDSLGRTYEYGEFFPPDLSPFAYNETVAQEFFPLTAGQAQQKGFRWKEMEERNYKVTLKAAQVPDSVHTVNDSIVKETIECAHKGTCNEQCTSAFRVIPQELEFYRTMNIPLPTLCPNCRHYGRLRLRNPLKLWHRQCMCDYKVYKNSSQHSHHPDGKCPNEFETSYAPDRKEIVYCEACYNNEVV